MSTSTTSPAPGEQEPATADEPGRQRRAMVVAGELLGVVMLLIVAVWCWRRGVVPLRFQVADGAPATPVTLYVGSWIASAVGIAVLAGLLALDAVRRTLPAVLNRTRRRSGTQAATDTVGDTAPTQSP